MEFSDERLFAYMDELDITDPLVRSLFLINELFKFDYPENGFEPGENPEFDLIAEKLLGIEEKENWIVRVPE